MPNSSSVRIYFLVVCLIIAWGLTWPIAKIGLAYIPSIWFAAFRLLIGMISIFILVAWTGNLIVPSKKDLPIILVMGIIQMALLIGFISTGLHYVDPGRSAMLVYTTPLWVIPLAVIFFKEELTIYKALGFLLGICGIFILFSPWGIDWSDKNALLGNALLMLGALSWAIAILCARNMTWHHTPLELIPWQLLIGTVPVFVLAYYVQPHESIQWNLPLICSLLFSGILGTAFGFWGSIVVSKELPSITVSLCYLAIPVAGIIFSALIIHEHITAIMVTAMLFILSGVACVAWGSRRPSVDHQP